MLAAFVLPLASRADPASEPARFCYECQQLDVAVGGGWGIPLFTGTEREVEHTRTFEALARWSIGVTDPVARGAFYEGNLQFGLEPLVILNFDPRDGWAAGGCAVLHYNFLAAGGP